MGEKYGRFYGQKDFGLVISAKRKEKNAHNKICSHMCSVIWITEMYGTEIKMSVIGIS